MKKDTYFEGLSSFTLCWIFPLCFFSSEWEKHCRFIYTSLYTFAHLDLQAVVDSCRPQETESRRRVLSTADKTESSLCVSVLSVFSQVTNPLSDSLLCWGYPQNMPVHVSLNDLCFILSAITKCFPLMPWKMYDRFLEIPVDTGSQVFMLLLHILSLCYIKN